MKCRNARKLVSEFIDGLKSDTKRLELEKHLSGCEDCDKYASQLTRCMDLLHRAPRETTSDNFAWKVRLKINQERNSVRERSASYGTLIRSWNLRFATTAASAAAVGLVGGLFLLKSAVEPATPDTYQATRVAGETSPTPTPGTFSSQPEFNITRDTTPPVRSVGQPSNLERRVSMGPPVAPVQGASASSRLVGHGSPNRSSSGRIIGVDLIDRTQPMSVADMDSLIIVQLYGLNADEQVQYLSRHIQSLQRHLIRAALERHRSR